MKKDDVIIITCDICGAMSHAIKDIGSDRSLLHLLLKGYYVKAEIVLCRPCFGDLK